jgi:hypothetical protein
VRRELTLDGAIGLAPVGAMGLTRSVRRELTLEGAIGLTQVGARGLTLEGAIGLPQVGAMRLTLDGAIGLALDGAMGTDANWSDTPPTKAHRTDVRQRASHHPRRWPRTDREGDLAPSAKMPCTDREGGVAPSAKTTSHRPPRLIAPTVVRGPRTDREG